MSQQELTRLPVHQLAQQIAARQLSPVELTEAYLQRIAALEPKLHAYVDVYAEEARAAPKRPSARVTPSGRCTASRLR
jgi:aspartyl-tRNA(Asn)/glutamyl-tRNA(Gln) amidotransferase subunit A